MAVMVRPSILSEERVPDDSWLLAFPRILAIDPGDHTGWSIVWFDPDVVFDNTRSIVRAPVAWQCGFVVGQEDNQVDRILAHLRRKEVGGEGLAVVLEDFILRSQYKDRSLLSPVRINAKFEFAFHRGVREADGVVRRRVFPPDRLQSSSDAKNVITDARLKLWQMYLPGPDHPRDATRHALLWLRKLRQRGEDYYDTVHFSDDGEAA